jgi:hypothetical protein
MSFVKVNTFVVMILTVACSLNAEILNGGFDANSGTPVFWQIDPNGVSPQIRQSFSTDEIPYPSKKNPPVTIQPFDGQYFVLLRSDSRDHVPTRRDSEDQLIDFCQLSQEITVRAGQRITGAYFFCTGDYMPFNDTATIKLIPDPYDNRTEILLAHKDVASVGSYQTMLGWESFVHDFNDTNAGTYTLVLEVVDSLDYNYTSRLAVDAIKIECSYAPAGDINGDCKVDLYDFTLLANQWLSECTQPPCSADINEPADHVVNFYDLAIVVENWLIDCRIIPRDQACVPLP